MKQYLGIEKEDHGPCFFLVVVSIKVAKGRVFRDNCRLSELVDRDSLKS